MIIEGILQNWIKKRICFSFPIILLLLVSFSAIAQREITIIGTVQDSLNNPIPYVDVLLKKTDSSQQILAFGITDKYGQYKIGHAPADTSVLIEVASLGFKKVQKTLELTDGIKYEVNITLRESAEALEEIVVVAEPTVKIKKDTTVFNLDRITNGTERIVEDILKKLPGVEIDDNGLIKFKGKKVGNVLLDGDNLFDGGYTIGTKTINAEHIKGVEAIENFEDNPLLQGLTETDKVALNLKFQDGFNFSGSADLGYGIRDRYYANTTGIAITKKIKAYTTLNYNNMGRQGSSNYFDPMRYINSLNGANHTRFKAPTYLSGDIKNNIGIGQNSLKNDAFFGTFNILPKLSKTEELRLNLDYFSDRGLEENKRTTFINTDPDNPIVITEATRSNKLPRYFNSKLNYRKFFSKNSSINTQFKYAKLRNESRDLGLVNGVENGENLLQKEQTVQNTTNFTYRLNNRSALKMDGIVAFSEIPETLNLLTGIDFNTNELIPNSTNVQEIFSKKRSLNLSANYFTKTGKENKFSSIVEFDYFNNSLQSNLFDTNQVNVFSNNIHYNVFSPGLSLSYFLKFNKLEITPTVKTSLYHYTYEDLLTQTRQRDHTLLLNSTISLNYEFNSHHTVFGSLAHTNEAPDEKRLYSDFILQSNRSLRNNELNFDPQTTSKYDLGYRYDDLFKDYSASINFSHQKNNTTYFNSMLYTPDVSYYTYFLRDFGSKMNSIRVSGSKYVSPLRTTFTLSSSYSANRYFNRVNNAEIRENQNNSYNATFDMSTSFIGKFIFSNNLRYQKNDFKSGVFKNNNESVVNTFELFYIPSSQLRFESELIYQVPDIRQGTNQTLFLNSELKYTNKKKSLTYKLEGKNLLNQKDVSMINTTDFSITNSTQGILERYFLLTVGFRF